MTTVTSTTDEACPYCGETSGVAPTPGTSPRVKAWSCTECGLDWAITVVNPHLADLVAATEEICRLRWTLREIITLATDAPHLADVELRARLLELAAEAAR